MFLEELLPAIKICPGIAVAYNWSSFSLTTEPMMFMVRAFHHVGDMLKRNFAPYTAPRDRISTVSCARPERLHGH